MTTSDRHITLKKTEKPQTGIKPALVTQIKTGTITAAESRREVDLNSSLQSDLPSRNRQFSHAIQSAQANKLVADDTKYKSKAREKSREQIAQEIKEFKEQIKQDVSSQLQANTNTGVIEEKKGIKRQATTSDNGQSMSIPKTVNSLATIGTTDPVSNLHSLLSNINTSMAKLTSPRKPPQPVQASRPVPT